MKPPQWFLKETTKLPSVVSKEIEGQLCSLNKTAKDLCSLKVSRWPYSFFKRIVEVFFSKQTTNKVVKIVASKISV